MAYKLTPADRRARAELIRAQRDARFAAQRRDAELKRIEGESSPSEESEKNSFLRALITAGDVGGNVLGGLATGLEGLHDFEQSLVPSGLGLILSGSPIDFAKFIWAKKNPEKHRELIEKDFAGTYVSAPLQRATKDSYTNDGKAGEVVEGVASGIGQMLPAVAVTALTGGAGAPAAATQALSLGTTAVSAAGNATEQAFRDGAGYGEGVLYGVASGAVEAGTEKLMGGLGGLYGKGVKGAVKAGVKSVAKTGVKRIAAEAAGEAVEEALAEVVNPTLKTIYKGKDALAEYGEAEFWGGVGEAALIGGLTSPAYGETVGRALKTSGTYADARSVMDHIGEQQDTIDSGELCVEQEVQARKNIKADYEVLSRRLMRTFENTRANVLKNPQLAAAFDADGTLKADFVAQLDGRIRAAGDTSSGLDRRYYSATARGREAEIIEGLAAQGTKVYEGELSAEEDAAYQKAKQIHSKLRSMGFVETDLVLSETMPDANAYLDGNTVVIGKDSLADGSYIKHLVHETTHFTEGTQEWVDVMEHVFGKDAKGVSALMQRVMESGYGVTQADVDAVVQAVLDGNLKDAKLTKPQQTLVSEVVAMQMEETFGNEAAIKRLVGEKPNLAKQILSRIKAFLQTFGKKSSKDPEAIQNLRRTEELFRKALQNAGVRYAVDELTRVNPENMHVSGENDAEIVDEGSAVRYNKRTTADEKAGTEYLIQNFNGAVNVDYTELYLSEQELAAISHAVKSGDGKLDSSRTHGRVCSGNYFYPFIFNDDGSITITQELHVDNERSAIEITEGALNHVTGESRKVGDFSDWTKLVRNGQGGHNLNDRNGYGKFQSDRSVASMDGGTRGSNDGGNLGRSGENRQNSQVSGTFVGYYDDVAGGRRKVYDLGEGRFRVENARKDTAEYYSSPEAAIEAENESLIKGYAKEHFLSPSEVKRKLDADPDLLSRARDHGIQFSRKSAGGVVTISEGEMAKLHANYAGDKVFDKKSVSEALGGVEAFKKLPAEIRNEFINRIWTGYNQRLHQQGFEQFTEIMWNQLHATIMQEVGYDEQGSMTEEQYAEAERVMDEQIVAALHQIVASGKPSIKAKLESATSTEGYRNQARFWRDEHARVVARNKLLGRVKFEVEKLANLKAGRYVNAANYKNNIFSKAITELARMNWRGGMVRDAKIREHFAALAAWYSKDNPLYKTSEGGNELFRQDIKDALEMLGNAQNGALTNDDLLAAESVIKYFAHEIEAHNTVYRDGKRVDAMPEAKRYVENVARAKEIAVKCGIWQRLTHSGFARLVADPAMLMRQADGYLDGFFTDQYEQLRQGTIDAAVMERELAEEFEKFWDDHKAYGRRYNNATVTFDGKEMPLQEAISLYMTMKREQAWAGLAGAGFEIEGKDATESVSEGFAELVEKHRTEEYKKLSDEDILTLTKEGHARIDQIALEKAIEEKRETLFAQFTDEDKALISLMEKTLEDCRDVKVKIDEIVQGYSNVTGGYYFPIRRTGLAENVDAWTGFEGDRVSNLSINKDTVKNAHKLLIEPAHIVFMRHLKAVSLYHGLGVFTDNFNRLFNLNVNGPQIKNAAQSAVEAYAKAEVHSGIAELVKRVKRGTHKHNDAVDLGTVSREVGEKIKAVTGQDFTGYKIAIEARQIEHILKRHGENGSADHSMERDEDIAKMLFAILAPDTVRDGGTTNAYMYMVNGKNRPAKTVVCERVLGNKSYYAIQTVTDTKKKTLHIVSAFIGKSEYKKGVPQFTNEPSPGATSETVIAGTPANSIPQTDSGVNPQNSGTPLTIRDAIGRSNKFAKEMLTYFKELKQDVEGISKKRSQEKAYNDVVAYIRSAYATYQLGANPKVWVTQLSSLVAATNLLDLDCLARGVRVSGKDVDEFCRLAWLRNNDNAAAMAQAVSTPQNAVQRAGRGVLRIVRDAAMAPIGKVDRLVICRLFAACQVQVQKKGGAKIGTRENKVEAGKLLQRVILETQQNSLATERSAVMRSGDEFVKAFTMFSADAMKVGARFVDAFGELSALKTLRKEAKKAGNTAETERLDKKISRARKQCGRATASLVGVAIFNALIAYGFKWLYRRDDEENAGTFIADTFGNMLGGIPFIRDFWSFFQDGFEMDHFLISTVNDVLGTAAASFELVKDAAGGKEITRQQALGNMRKVLYAAGQLSGIPVRNVYNVATGMLNRVSPKAGYSAEALFVAKPFASDLKKAIEADDEEMIGTIAGLMVEEKGVENAELQGMFRELVGKGYSVLPRSVGDKVSMNGTEIALSGKQQKRFRELYRIGDEAVTDMVKLRQFSSADEEVRAKAVQFIYDVYWDLALESVTGEDLAERNVLFAEAIPIEKLAIIIATARAIEADKDKDGKAISGTKKRKVQTFVNSLHLTAAQKYMVMGYLGYSNINGKDAVKGYINKLNLSKGEKAALLKYSGYAG